MSELRDTGPNKPIGKAIVISDAGIILYAGYLLALAVVGILTARGLGHSEHITHVVVVFGLAAVIPGTVLLRKPLDVSEPLIWFGVSYSLFVPAALYFMLTGFAFTDLDLLGPGRSRDDALGYALMLLFGGWLAFAAGYLMIRPSLDPPSIQFDAQSSLPNVLVYTAVLTLVAAGALNFVLVAGQYPGGVSAFLADFGIQANRLEQISGQVTTIGYQGFYIGALLAQYGYLRHRAMGRRCRLPMTIFVLTLLTAMLVLVSQGRIAQLVTYVLVVALLHHSASGQSASSTRVLLVVLITFLVGIAVYIGRLVSGLVYLGFLELEGITPTEVLSASGKSILFLLFDKGNTPALPVLVDILARWDPSLLLWGKSFLSWIGRFAGLGNIDNVGSMIGREWFHRDAEIPPTIIGEFVFNFGPLSVPPMMFVVGLLAALLWRAVSGSASYWIRLAYLFFLFRFFWLWPKGESSYIANAIWGFLPTLLVVGLLMLIAAGLSRNVREEVT